MQKSESIQYKIQAVFKDTKLLLARSAKDRTTANLVAKLFETSIYLTNVTISWDGGSPVVVNSGTMPADIDTEYHTKFSS